MTIWQADFYRRPLQDDQSHFLWELLVCDPSRRLEWSAFCSQPEATVSWLSAQFRQLIATEQPEAIQVFRPQSLTLIAAACQPLAIPVEPSRQVPALKQWLQERSQRYPQMPGYTGQPYDPLRLEKPPPQPLPQKLWGESWQFVTLAARDLEDVLLQRPIPVVGAPKAMLPGTLQLPKSTRIPGVIIYGSNQSLKLAHWLQARRPVSLHFTAGSPSGLVLEAGLIDRWILVTFEDAEIVSAATAFERRQQASQGLHFLLVQPDDSGVTFSGLWLLQAEA